MYSYKYVIQSALVGVLFSRLRTYYLQYLFVGYTFTSPLGLISVVHHRRITFPPAFGETGEQITHILRYLKLDVVDFKDSRGVHWRR